MFKVIIAGGRDFNYQSEHLDYISKMISRYYDTKNMIPKNGGVELVTGCAKGADQIPYFFNTWHGTPIKEFPADWKTHGKKAGILRNIEMAEYADALIAFWDGKSRGTKHMIETAKKYGLKTRVVYY